MPEAPEDPLFMALANACPPPLELPPSVMWERRMPRRCSLARVGDVAVHSAALDALAEEYKRMFTISEVDPPPPPAPPSTPATVSSMLFARGAEPEKFNAPPSSL